ncbi:glutamate--tRNA ligase [Ihubacter massiliensis]|uniref:Glutamate--tRNA ligase n=1 Tax=Hominibacterium faecale TaxID=2839743 RepID=A0A9J6QV60_9FIRM|nr:MULTISPECIES: glutamate--tRNA ligase [Eubacteriales Family XIII. Incertae Sedis]MCC2865891.1 glutamate--tRNA ligase [Anaerovorax odorimutans]MCO7123331.1 glutamate--tRNA ligase [Ihubacter massiliensis]MCU7379780.1 glutamate--tRNA ligase [Hominibacterium faecale]MDE8735073.1 glutamate--tRNA ligase [Eubacteriales bacterium DFI.9.88]
MNYDKLAELLFPHITKTPEDYETIYPPRQLPAGAKVTRLGPSPTGFIHLGNLYGAFVDERLARQSGGIFYLRIEDTDDKRYVDGAVETIITSLDFFGIDFDEGAAIDGSNGDYGPYYQSQRGEIYQCYVKALVKKGQAYPCFLTEEEIAAIRQNQEQNKENPGIYGEYAPCRGLTLEEIEQNINAGKPYVIRLKSDGHQDPQKARTISIEDGIRGILSMPENYQDVVILKATGIPTYHFAHVVDDHLMRTTHVVRGEEWISSLPIHVELFEKLGFEMPIFCHTAQLMKLDNGNKRKLSKRKDPELSLDYYRQEGYMPQAVREYLLTVLNSNYEEWRQKNPDADAGEFPFQVEKMSNSGALFDLDKLNDVSKDVLVKIPADQLCAFLKQWAGEFKPEILPLLEGHEDYIEKILDLGRSGKKPRKDLVYGKQIFQFIRYFFDDYFEIEDAYPENASDDVKEILSRYLETYDHSDDQSQWFDKIRAIGEELNYAARPKDYKKNPDQYKGHVGDVSTVIRIAVMGRSQSPDVWEIQQILGEERTKARLKAQL